MKSERKVIEPRKLYELSTYVYVNMSLYTSVGFDEIIRKSAANEGRKVWTFILLKNQKGIDFGGERISPLQPSYPMKGFLMERNLEAKFNVLSGTACYLIV